MYHLLQSEGLIRFFQAAQFAHNLVVHFVAGPHLMGPAAPAEGFSLAPPLRRLSLRFTALARSVSAKTRCERDHRARRPAGMSPDGMISKGGNYYPRRNPGGVAGDGRR